MILGVRRGYKSLSENSYMDINAQYGTLAFFDASNGNTYQYLISNGTPIKIVEGNLIVRLSIEKVDTSHVRITRTSGTGFVYYCFISIYDV